MNELQIGQLVDGKYKIQALLGSGAFGAVYKAYHNELNRPVAIKVLGIRGDLSEDTRSRFSREARLLSSLSHPNVIGVYSYGLLENAIPYIAMEYLDGKTLADRLMDDEPLPPNVLIEIFMQVCSGLAAAHAAGIIHRDLKPENIFLAHSDGSGPGFRVRILDFGLSRQFADGLTTSQRLTQTGALLGSVQYMSPEAASGQVVDRRSDIYSLACILYQCVAGRVPYDADTPLGILYKQQNETLPQIDRNRLALAPPGTEMLIAKAMQKDPSARFQSAEEMMEALKALKLQDVQLLSSLCDANGANPTQGKRISLIPVTAAFILIAGITASVVYSTSHRSDSLKSVSGQFPANSKHNTKIRSGDLLTLNSRFSKAHSAYFNLENRAAAEDLRSIERDAADLQSYLRIKSKLVDCLMIRARCLSDLDEIKPALALCEQALEECLNSPAELATQAAGIRTTMAQLNLQLGNKNESERLARENLVAIGEIVKAYEAGDDAAQMRSTVITEVGLSTALCQGLLSQVEYDRGNYKSALEYAKPSAFFMEARGISDGENSMRFMIANCLIRMNQKEKAEKSVEEFAKRLGTIEQYRDEYASGKTDAAGLLNRAHVVESIYLWFAANGFTDKANQYKELGRKMRELAKESPAR